MSDSNSFRQWLGIAPSSRPLNAYELLGLPLFTADEAAISQAALRQTARVRQHLAGPQAAAAQRVIQEIAAARKLLLSASSRAAYDARLGDAARPAAVSLPQAAVPTAAQAVAAGSVAPLAAAIPQGAPIGQPVAAPVFAAPVSQQPQAAAFATAISPIARPVAMKNSSAAGMAVVAGLFLLVVAGLVVVYVQRDKLLAKLQGPAVAQSAVQTPSTTSPSPTESAAARISAPAAQPAPQPETGLFSTVDPSFAPANAKSPPGMAAPGLSGPAAMLDSAERTSPEPSTPRQNAGPLGAMDPTFVDVEMRANTSKAPAAAVPPTAINKVDEHSAVLSARRQFFEALSQRNYDGALYQIQQAQQLASSPQSQEVVAHMKSWLASVEHFWQGARKGILMFEIGQVISVGKDKFEIKTLSSEKVDGWLLRGEKKHAQAWPVNRMTVDMLTVFAERGLNMRDENDATALAAFLAVETEGNRSLARNILHDIVKQGGDVAFMLKDIDTMP